MTFSLPEAVHGVATRRAIAALIVLGIGGCHSPSPAGDGGSTPVIGGKEIRTHIEILASDDMQGREAGTAGHRLAAGYVAAQFAEIGLAPLADGEVYLQTVPFLETSLVPDTESLVLHQGDTMIELTRGRDYARSGGFGEPVESITAPLVFVGFGITAPEHEHDDFSGIAVAGKILVLFTGAPPHFGVDERAFYSSTTGKQQRAADHGAVGILTVRTPVDQEWRTWPGVLAAAGTSGMRWLEPGGEPREGFPQLVGDAMLSESGAQKLFELAGRNLEELFATHAAGNTGSFDLQVSAQIRRESCQRRQSSPNVLGLLVGSDEELKEEYVLISAHLDHLGIGDGPEEDKVHNGAYDNAAGVATMLEVADALARLSPSPRRSIVFAAVTAEEKGLRGSDYLAWHPPVAIDQIVANINIDMPFFGYPIADVEAFGAEHSDLHKSLSLATAILGLTLTPDPRPELVRLIRSDQFSFVKRGVPGTNLQPGNSSSDSAVNGAELRSLFLREHYHEPSDDLELPFSEEGAARFAELVLTFSLLVANDDKRPQWIPGDFFGERFARNDAPKNTVPASSSARTYDERYARPARANRSGLSEHSY